MVDEKIKEEEIKDIIEDVSAWNTDSPSTYYDPDIDSRGYIRFKSAREILRELGLEK